jgi:mRNA-degrading endonuclease toxin of MazEF toxin-antitoxin module
LRGEIWDVRFDPSEGDEIKFWRVRLEPTAENGLNKASSADAFQVKSISIRRFQRKVGLVTPDQLAALASAIALCVGYQS